MDAAHIHAIDDIKVLRELALQQAAKSADLIAHHEHIVQKNEQTIAQRDQTIQRRNQLIDHLKQQIARLQRLKFAASSEKLDPDQRSLFDEAIEADLAALQALVDAEAPAPRAPAKRPSAPRRELPADLPRIETRHEPASCSCADCGGALVPVGEHVSEKLDIKPAEFFVRRDVYPQYACRACETIVAEPVAPAIIDRGLAAPGLLAHVTIGKYVDHLPAYRQESIYARSGVTIQRGTLSSWMGRVGFSLQPLVDALRAQLQTEPILHADETPIGVLDPGAGKTKRGYLFAYRSATANPVVVFEYCPSRSGKHAQRFLADWRGALMVDDFSGYKQLFPTGITDRAQRRRSSLGERCHEVTELGCWAHARRKFFDLHAASSSPIAADALQRIAVLYRIESEASDLDADQRTAHRQQHAAPAIAEFKQWLDTIRTITLGGSGTAKAIDYTLKRWTALTRYIDDGRFPIDNNPIENAIRPIALGRKNWLFAGSETAATRAAAIMSLLATAKANGQDPYAWLHDVLTRLPTTLNRDIGDLLPHRWKPALPTTD